MTSAKSPESVTGAVVDSWFWNEIGFYRLSLAAVSDLIILVVSSILTWTLLEASVLHPFAFLHEVAETLTDVTTLLLIVMLAASCLVTIIPQYKVLSCSSTDIDWHRNFLWMLAYYVANASADIVFMFICTQCIRVNLSTDERLIAYYTAFFAGSLLSVEFFTRREYILNFPQYVKPKTQQFFVDVQQIIKRLVRVSWKHWLCILGSFFIAGHYLIHYSLRRLPLISQMEIALPPVRHSFRAFALVGLIWTSFICYISTILRRKFSDKILNLWLCQPHEFEIPPANVFTFCMKSEDDSSAPNLTQAMASAVNEYIKYLAFWDLCRLSKLSKPRLHQLFQVSRPGGHPRSWLSVRDECLKLLGGFSSELHLCNNKLARSWELAVSRSKFGSELESYPKSYEQKFCETPGWILKDNGSLQGLESLLEENDIFQHYQLYAWTIESLGNIFCSAVVEDRFGVVQRDLGPVLSLLCDLYTALERFGRLCGTQKLAPTKRSSIDFTRQILKVALADSLKNIRSTYGDHLKSIELDEDRRRLISIL